MERARTSCAICIQASVAAFAGAVALSAQTNTPPQDWASQSPGTEERQAIAESLIGREEAASGRTFDPVFRTRAAARLALLPMEVLLQAQAGGRGGLATLGDSQADLVYTPLTPCRIIDTRVAGGAIAAGATRDFLVTGTSFASQGGSATGCGTRRRCRAHGRCSGSSRSLLRFLGGPAARVRFLDVPSVVDNRPSQPVNQGVSGAKPPGASRFNLQRVLGITPTLHIGATFGCCWRMCS